MDPYREREIDTPENSATIKKVVACSKCRYKAEPAYDEYGRSCRGSELYCLADYKGINPITGTKSALSHVKESDIFVSKIDKGRIIEGEVWVSLKKAVLCTKRNSTGQCELFVPSFFVARMFSSIKTTLISIFKSFSA